MGMTEKGVYMGMTEKGRINRWNAGFPFTWEWQKGQEWRIEGNTGFPFTREWQNSGFYSDDEIEILDSSFPAFAGKSATK